MKYDLMSLAFIVVFLFMAFCGCLLVDELIDVFRSRNFCESEGFEELESNKGDWIICKNYDVVDQQLVEYYQKFPKPFRKGALQ